jgi:transcriptional regulator with XRE-family HTH domain
VGTRRPPHPFLRHLYWCRVRLLSKLYGVRIFYAGVVEQTPVINMARFRTLSAHPNAMISAAQCRSARALLGWSVAKLASAASVSVSAIDDFEAERREPVPAVAGPIRRAFEPVGVAFLAGEDVRLRAGALFEVGSAISTDGCAQLGRAIHPAGRVGHDRQPAPRASRRAARKVLRTRHFGR